MAARHLEDSAVASRVVPWSNVPVRELVLDRLAELLLDADDILAILEGADAIALKDLVPRVRAIYDDVNGLMKGLAA